MKRRSKRVEERGREGKEKEKKEIQRDIQKATQG